jgi:hypothetical protein
MALSVNISPSDVASGTVQPTGTTFTISGTGWTVNGSGSQAFTNSGGTSTPVAGNGNHE